MGRVRSNVDERPACVRTVFEVLLRLPVHINDACETGLDGRVAKQVASPIEVVPIHHVGAPGIETSIVGKGQQGSAVRRYGVNMTIVNGIASDPDSRQRPRREEKDDHVPVARPLGRRGPHPRNQGQRQQTRDRLERHRKTQQEAGQDKAPRARRPSGLDAREDECEEAGDVVCLRHQGSDVVRQREEESEEPRRHDSCRPAPKARGYGEAKENGESRDQGLGISQVLESHGGHEPLRDQDEDRLPGGRNEIGGIRGEPSASREHGLGHSQVVAANIGLLIDVRRVEARDGVEARRAAQKQGESQSETGPSTHEIARAGVGAGGGADAGAGAGGRRTQSQTAVATTAVATRWTA